MSEFALLSQRVVLPDGARPAAVHVLDGRIEAICAPELVPLHVDVRDVEDLRFRNKLSPWLGRAVMGDVVTTWLRGVEVWDRGSHGAATGVEVLRAAR